MKRTKLSVAAVSVAGILALSAMAAGARSITAELRPDVAVRVNGEQQTMRDTNGDRIYPIQYNGTTYLPVRALGEALGSDVRWDSASQTVHLNTKTEEALGFTELESRMTKLEKEISDLKAASTRDGRAAQYATYSEKLLALEDEVDWAEDAAARAYRDGEILYDEYKTRKDRADRLEDRLDDAYRALKKKTVDTADAKPDGSADGTGWEDRLDGVETRVQKLEREARDASGAQQYRTVKNKAEALSDELDAFDDDLERARSAGKLTAAQYRALDNRADGLDDRLDWIEDRMEDGLDRYDHDDHDEYDD